LGWGAASVVGGVLIGWFARGAQSRLASAVAVQSIAWGAIDATIAGFALIGLARRQRHPPSPAEEPARREKSIRFVAFNVKLDVVYCLVGVGLLVGTRFAQTPDGRAALIGHGLGVIVQGGFLWAFDHVFAKRLRAAR
jgi:hypothetical protein